MGRKAFFVPRARFAGDRSIIYTFQDRSATEVVMVSGRLEESNGRIGYDYTGFTLVPRRRR